MGVFGYDGICGNVGVFADGDVVCYDYAGFDDGGGVDDGVLADGGF